MTLLSGDIDRLAKLIRAIERSPRRMTMDGSAYKALIPASVADHLQPEN